jgi:hypothetical protein
MPFRPACLIALVISVSSLTSWSYAQSATAPQVILKGHGKEGVKQYLISVTQQCVTASHDLKKAANTYAMLCKQDGSPQSAAKQHPKLVAQLIGQMRDAFRRIDSFGYEYVEGIVAGVPSLAKYDVELDAGVPRAGSGPDDDVAAVKIDGGDIQLNEEGSLNNFLLEPTVFGTNTRFTDGSATLGGFDQMVNLPKPRLLVALADYAIDGYTRLDADCKAWQPTDKDCFQALAAMTPTLADYFDDWKQARTNGSATGGRFVAVSRVSDMRGIMSSTRLTWLALADGVNAKDPALARSITQGYDQVLAFIDTVEKRDNAGGMQPQTIDALGSQANERTNKVCVQVAQAAALLNIDVN